MIKIKQLVLFLLITLCFRFSFSQTTVKERYSYLKSEGIFKTIWYDIKDSYKDGINLYTSPFHYTTEDVLIAGGVVITTASFFALDEPVKNFFKKQNSNFNSDLSKIVKQYGEFYSPLIIGGGTYFGGIILNDEYTRLTGRMVIEAAAYSGILVTLIKMTTGRSRPYMNDGNHKFKLFESDEGSLSFPSGHSAMAFAISSVLANRINNTYVSIGLYFLSSLTALSRVYDNQHWISDVFLGSAIGFFTGHYISRNSVSVKNSDCKKTTLAIMPEINFSHILFTINF